MIFAKLLYSEHYNSLHEVLHDELKQRFSKVEEGIQCDSWIWIWFGDRKVAVDTFTSMTHEVKSEMAGAHVTEVIEFLKKNYSLEVYDEPELEPHE